MLRALLVGIDEYAAPVARLQGCVADVDAVAALLVDRTPQDERDIRVLRNGEATRSGVVDAVRSHLGSARTGDVALLWYSGHGSRQRRAAQSRAAADEFDETLVLADSRAPGGLDLADRELGALVTEVAAGGAHVVVVLDSCHSGSGTRDEADDAPIARRAPSVAEPRDSGSYLPGTPPPAPQAARGQLPSGAPAESGWELAVGRHVLLAACRSDQLAKEVVIAGARRGAFSAAIEQTLRTAVDDLTYRDLVGETRRLLRALVRDQDPQLEITRDGDDLRVALTGALDRRPRHHLLAREPGAGWVVDAGALHGVPAPAGGPSTRFDVYPMSARDLTDPAGRVATATVVEVRPASSVVDVQGSLDPGSTYRAVVAAWGRTPVLVALPSGDDVLAAAVAASADVGVAGATSARPDLEVAAVDGEYVIGDLVAGREVARTPVGNVAVMLRALEHVARWHRVERLGNPVTRIDLPRLDVRVELSGAGEQRVVPWTQELVLPYEQAGDAWQPQALRVLVRNGTSTPLTCALVALSESYAVSSQLLPGGAVTIPPGGEIRPQDSPRIRARVPDVLWQRGVSRRTDELVLLVGTEPFDPAPLAQPAVDEVVQPDVGLREAAAALADDRVDDLNALLASVRLVDRELDVDDDGPVRDWTVLRMRVVAERPLPGTPVGDADVPLGPGVRLESHPTLRARARLASEAAASRDALVSLTPPLFLDVPESVAPFSLSQTRAGEAPADVLELTDLEGADGVTPSEPLRLVVEGVDAGVQVLVVGFDGENYLPVGWGGTGGIRIEQLPPAVTTRSLTGAVRLLFRRLTRTALRLPRGVTRLAIVGLDQQGEPAYDADRARIRAAIEAADDGRVLVVVHGIIGDTRGMVRCLLGLPEHNRAFDVLLAFDYENLQTRVDETAQLLRDALVDVGLGPDDHRRLTLVAHSMGGLVSRWMIERTEGARFTDHLVTLGSPYGGSPWPKVEDWALATLAFGLNRLAAVFWPAHVLSGLVALVEKVDTALDDMAPGSERLDALYHAPDPHVRLDVVIGDRSLVATPDPDGRVARLLAALSPHRALDVAVALAFHDLPNDLAVSVTSGRLLPPGRDPAPRVTEVACDHVTYFDAAVAVAALLAALEGADDAVRG